MLNNSGIEAVKNFLDDKIDRFHELNLPEPGKAFINPLVELMKNSKPAKFLIKGFIYAALLSSLTGATMAGKTFVAILAAFCVATGIPFHGRKVLQANVLYIAGEGNYGLIARFMALLIKYGLPEMPPNLFVTSGPIDLLNQKDVEMIATFIQENDIKLVVIDTFARSFAADENSAKDMGAAIAAITKYFIGTGAAVLMVHHTGHGDQSRARGSSSFRAALDTEIGVEKVDGGLKLKCWKAKDFEPWPDENYKFTVVDTGILDEDGLTITSLVLEPDSNPKKQISLSRADSELWNALRNIGKTFTDEEAKRFTYGLIRVKNKGQALVRLITKLIEQGLICYKDGIYSVVS
ncbi:MAG: AAA family ATPase [Methylobacter sp.]|nr:AAA family ATPase [Methylobacter sp.]